MRLKTLSLFITLFATSLLKAQTPQSEAPKALQWGVSAGLNIGATAPLPIPSALTKMYAWYPNINPSAKLWGLYRLKKHSPWGLSFALEAERKSFSATTLLTDLEMSLPESDDVGRFSGNQNVSIATSYLTLPIGLDLALLRGRLHFRLEGYASLLMSSKFTVKLDGDGTIDGEALAPGEILYFDFDDQIRPYDLGLRFGAKYYFTRRLGAEVQLSYGLTPATKSSFSNMLPRGLNHIYGYAGLSYRIGR